MESTPTAAACSTPRVPGARYPQGGVRFPPTEPGIVLRKASSCRAYRAILSKLQEQGVWESVAQEGELLTTQHKKRHNVSSREKVMARDSSDFAQHSSERAMQAANFGMNWSREFAEQTFGQSRQAVDAFLRVTRKMAEDFENQATVVREHMTSLTEKTLSNTMEYGEKLSRAKEPQEFAQCQSDFLARQAQTIADQTKEFSQKFQKAAQLFASNASNAMAEATRRSEDAVSNIASRAEQASKRRAEA